MEIGENVIIANEHGKETENQDNVKFDYKNGAIEDNEHNKTSNFILDKSSIKGHICDIMEGGLEAFNRRKQSYDIL